MKLISMTEFVIEQSAKIGLTLKPEKYCLMTGENARFLEQPLELGMFVSCDLEGNELEEPLNYKKWLRKELNTTYTIGAGEQYQQAGERVLFENHKHDLESLKDLIRYCPDVEDAIRFLHNSTLTKTAQKQIGL